MPVKSLELRVYVHATEDRERVVESLKNVLGDWWNRARVAEEVYEGHYGNPVRVITVRIDNIEDANKALDYILSRLGEGDRGVLLQSLEDRVDKEGTLYFRLSKQEAYLGRLLVYESDDVIRVAVSFQGRRRNAMEEYRRRLGGVE